MDKIMVGERIRELRNKNGVSIYKLADDIHREPDLIVKMQRGECIYLPNMFLISRYFGVTLDYLYGLPNCAEAGADASASVFKFVFVFYGKSHGIFDIIRQKTFFCIRLILN